MFTKLSPRRMLCVAAVLCGLGGAAFLGVPAEAGKTAPPPKAPPYSYQTLGTLGGTDSWAQSINNWGDVVGQSKDAAGRWTAFLSTIDAGGVAHMQDLNTLLEPADRLLWHLDAAGGINDDGQIAGYGKFNSVPCGFRYTPAYDDASGGHHLAGIEAVGQSATTINSLGNVAGFYNNLPFWAEYDPDLGWVPQSFGNDAMSVATINRGNQVCGWISTSSGYRAYRFTPGQGILNLGFLKPARGGFTWSYGNDMDDNGQVVGESSAGTNGHAFRYVNSMVDLGTLGGGWSSAHGISRSGTMIVGGSTTASGSGHLFLYTTSDGKMMDLEAAIENLPPGLSGLLTNQGGGFRRINDFGLVCGHAGPNSGAKVAFLLTPK